MGPFCNSILHSSSSGDACGSHRQGIRTCLVITRFHVLCTCTQSAPRVDGSIILRWDNLDHSMILWVEKIKYLFNDWFNHSAIVGDWLPLNLDRFPLRRGILFVRIFKCYLHPNSSNTQTIQQFKCGIKKKKKPFERVKSKILILKNKNKNYKN